MRFDSESGTSSASPFPDAAQLEWARTRERGLEAFLRRRLAFHLMSMAVICAVVMVLQGVGFISWDLERGSIVLLTVAILLVSEQFRARREWDCRESAYQFAKVRRETQQLLDSNPFGDRVTGAAAR